MNSISDGPVPQTGKGSVVTLAGTNSFLLHQDLKQRIAAFVATHGDLALEQLDGEEAAVDRIREALESLPFLASRKMVVLRTPGANKDFVERAEGLLSNAPETTEVLIVEPKIDKRSAYYKYLHKQTEYVSFDDLDENGLTAWLVRQAKAQGGDISMADARYVVGRAGTNQQLLANELTKLLLYEPHINRQSIDLLVEPMPQSSIFDLLDAAFSGNTKRAMSLYAEQRKARVEPQQIMAMIIWQLHVLAIVKAAGQRDAAVVAKDAKLNPYVVRKSMQVARTLTPGRLRQLIHAAAVLDTRLKSESLDTDDALQGYILRLSGVA